MAIQKQYSEHHKIIWTQLIREFPLRSGLVIVLIVLTSCLFALNLWLWKVDGKREVLTNRILLLKKEGVHYKNLLKITDDQVYLAIITKNLQYKASFIEYQNHLEATLQHFGDVSYQPLAELQDRIFRFIALEDYYAANQTYNSLKYRNAEETFNRRFLEALASEEKKLIEERSTLQALHLVNFGLIALSLLGYLLSWLFFALLMGQYSSKIIGNLDRSLATLAHDFRSPISSILGYSECLREGLDGPVTEAQVTSLQKIEKVGHNLLDLMNDLLDVAKIQAGQVQLLIEPLDIGNIMQYCSEAIEPQIRQKNLEFKHFLPTERLIVQIDGVKTTEIINNLLHNALKFTDEGFIELGHSVKSGFVEVYVKDSGEGLSDKEIAHIFEPFVQADFSVKARGGGIGLGLSIAHHFARIQGGDLTVVSRSGFGCQFTLSIPYKEER